MPSEIENDELSFDNLTPIYNLFSKGKYKEALSSLDTLSQKFPNNHNLYSIGAECYFALDQYELSISCYDESIKLNPYCADYFNNKSNALEKLRKFDEAISCCKKAIEIRPDFDLAFYNLGINAKHLRLYELSLDSLNMAIQLDPDNEKYKFAKATLLLLYEDFKNGWLLFESRWKVDNLYSPKIDSNYPTWTGNKNAKLLVWPEQGIGDHILYSALIPELKKKCSNLTILVDRRLVDLLSRSMGNLCTIYPATIQYSELDYDEQISMGSLCQYLRNDEKDFLTTRNGFLKDDKIKTLEFKEDLLALCSQSNNKICGISWRSQTLGVGVHKSISLKNMIEILDLKGYTFVSLQYGDTLDEIKEVKNELGIDIISFKKVDNFNDIDGLASLIQSCDTIISIDNVTCQLAGALGKEIHILLTLGSWWGWGVNRSDSPCYNSVKIYRQETNETISCLIKKLNENFKI